MVLTREDEEVISRDSRKAQKIKEKLLQQYQVKVCECVCVCVRAHVHLTECGLGGIDVALLMVRTSNVNWLVPGKILRVMPRLRNTRTNCLCLTRQG